jgi:Bax protein
MYKSLGLLALPFAFNVFLNVIIDNFNATDENDLLFAKSLSFSTNTYLEKNLIFESSIIKKTSDKSSEKDLINPIKLLNYDWKPMFSQKKIEFIETVLPIITFENKKILNERKRLIEIKKYLHAEKTLMDEDILYLSQIVKKYNIKSWNKHKIDVLDELLILVDVIPNSIVLAQAVNESGWGTSRFAKEHNALFGEYTYDEKKGTVPLERESGKKHLIRNFSSLNKSVESYFRNINTHYAYEEFREIRSQIHQKNSPINIKLLTETLDVYAEDELYVDTINSIIDSNKFNQFDILI